MRKLFVLLLVVFVAGLAAAIMPTGEAKIESDGWQAIGTTHVDAIADGEVRLSFYRRAGTSWIRYPLSAAGDTCYTLIENIPRGFSHTAGIDSVYVDLVDATFVVLTWR